MFPSTGPRQKPSSTTLAAVTDVQLSERRRRRETAPSHSGSQRVRRVPVPERLLQVLLGLPNLLATQFVPAFRPAARRLRRNPPVRVVHYQLRETLRGNFATSSRTRFGHDSSQWSGIRSGVLFPFPPLRYLTEPQETVLAPYEL